VRTEPDLSSSWRTQVALVMELGGAVLLELSDSGRRPALFVRTVCRHDFVGWAVKTRRMSKFPQQGFELGRAARSAAQPL